MERGLNLDGFDPDSSSAPALAFRVRTVQTSQEIPFHFHRKGQLILALHGGVTTEVQQAMWMVPTHYAVWIPSNMPHSNRVTANARLSFLFIEPGSVEMPEQCCTLKISPLVRELILHLASIPYDNLNCPMVQRLTQVLFDELPKQPIEQLELPISGNARIREMVDMMARDLQDKRPLSSWADTFAMSERNLARLIVKETGLNFRRWRQQLQLIIALRLLVGGLNVQQVAESLGYDSTTAFITMFKKALGTTPGRYLKTLTNNETE
ncbi:helix-turn-helix domain-containing protein [Klebsiella sp. BIGb0407]|uniref:AraC family transcriptional regulator n=1 Tax=Klebsiella sp. BIGb0407 TaxID=2940603 RepID=UPI002167CC72|nr:helix-turn-helix transcriptional regulator [Klebsiella sp. BIGb0407]MCS3429502.1 AraC-like DNA-binding protein [Klebsiella sp. BIGb0407]